MPEIRKQKKEFQLDFMAYLCITFVDLAESCCYQKVIQPTSKQKDLVRT